MKKEHLPLLDNLRIVICVVVLLFHAVIHKFWIIPEKTLQYFMNFEISPLTCLFLVNLTLSIVAYILFDKLFTSWILKAQPRERKRE